MIRKTSKKRAKQEREYFKLAKEFLKDNPLCQAKIVPTCTAMSLQVHHKRGRIGSLLTDTKYFLAVCHYCHCWIEWNPKKAKEMGFSESRLSNT